MRALEIDGRLQVTAADRLLSFSRLVQFDTVSGEFTEVPHELFESHWRKSVDPVFGRLICWINFSAGAEFMAKGICLLKGVEIRSCKGGTTNFGTIRDLYTDKKDKAAALKRLCTAVGANNDQQELLLSSYECLGKLRNRDVHAYVPNVRDSHFGWVRDRFIPCFNLLISWLPEGPHTLNTWGDGAPQFITSLL